MNGDMADVGRRPGNHWRVAGWGLATLLLLLPLIAMQFTEEVNWDAADFAIAAALIVAIGIILELTVSWTGSIAYRAAMGAALATALVLIWMNLAVGIIGAEDNAANFMYVGVLVVGTIGAVIARFQPRGMSRALIATAIAQALVGAIALVFGLGSTGPAWPASILGLTGCFAALWLISAALFRMAARKEAPAGATM